MEPGRQAWQRPVESRKTGRYGRLVFQSPLLSGPVQPGSLGIEAMLQLLQFHMLQEEMDAGMTRARFEPLVRGWRSCGNTEARSRRGTTKSLLTSIFWRRAATIMVFMP
ncbi:hypothetical protein D3H35_01670 [Cohnella faecalis]|uniref:Uncharacterized protein n=1 Tax=Cohnella faecalis TaxID=2315694 RepID=A0A398CT04_9BACL|nr:hypothetical protein D3H35_01670 [Cohnella faecalis]